MILKQHRCSHKLPEVVESSTAQLCFYPHGDRETNPSSYAILLPRVALDELLEVRGRYKKELFGAPTAYALKHSRIIKLFPTPDRDYCAKLSYCPAMKEI